MSRISERRALDAHAGSGYSLFFFFFLLFFRQVLSCFALYKTTEYSVVAVVAAAAEELGRIRAVIYLRRFLVPNRAYDSVSNEFAARSLMTPCQREIIRVIGTYRYYPPYLFF